jgi:hypothetical protein
LEKPEHDPRAQSGLRARKQVGHRLLYPLGLPAVATRPTRPSGPHPPGYREDEQGTLGREISVSTAWQDGGWAVPRHEKEKGGQQGLTSGLGSSVRQAPVMASEARAYSSNQGARRLASATLRCYGGEEEWCMALSTAQRWPPARCLKGQQLGDDQARCNGGMTANASSEQHDAGVCPGSGGQELYIGVRKRSCEASPRVRRQLAPVGGGIGRTACGAWR